jgi:hypothetical protein
MRHALGDAYINYDRAFDEALERGNNKFRLGSVGCLK